MRTNLRSANLPSQHDYAVMMAQFSAFKCNICAWRGVRLTVIALCLPIPSCTLFARRDSALGALQHGTRPASCLLGLVADKNATLQAYRTWLGFYKGSMKLCRWNAEQLVQAANRYAVTLGELL